MPDDYQRKNGSAQAIATILDPRCKLATFRNLSRREEWIQAAQESIYPIYAAHYAPAISSEQSHTSTPNPCKVTQVKMMIGTIICHIYQYTLQTRDLFGRTSGR